MAARVSALVLRPELAARMGVAGRCRVERRFSTAAQLAATLDLYARLDARPSSSAGRFRM
jgi:hypothetical protein